MEISTVSIKNEDLFYKVFNALNDKIAVFDEKGNILFSNNSWNSFSEHFNKRDRKYCPQCLKKVKEKEKLSYFTESPFIFCSKVLPDISKAIIEIIDEKRSDFTIDYFCRAFGKELYFQSSISCINIKPLRILIRHTDITEYKSTQAQVTNLNKFLTSILDSLPNPFYVIDTADYSIKMANKIARTRGIKVGNKCYQSTHKVDEPCFFSGHPCPVREVLKRKKPVLLDHIHYDEFGKEYYIEVNACPIFQKNRKIHQIIEYSVDVTSRRKAENELVKKTRELELSNKELEQFAYVVSHDLKQPLFAISGYLDILSQKYSGSVDNLGKTIINNAYSTSQRMQSLIENLMDYALIHKKDVEFKKINLETVIKNVLSNLNALLTDKQAKITYGSMPVIYGQQRYLEQLIQNLISNSIKFCESTPEITVHAVKQANEWIISVKDNGIGIENEYASRIFEVFQRLHSNAKYPGHGLGLAICKKIADIHKGRIWVESRVGEGSTFFFALPV